MENQQTWEEQAEARYQQWLADHPTVTKPTDEQKMINQLGLQVAALTTNVNQLESGGSNG